MGFSWLETSLVIAGHHWVIDFFVHCFSRNWIITAIRIGITFFPKADPNQIYV
jgi:hypothetical protein